MLDDAVVKIMSALGVSFVPAYESMKEFETRLNALSAKVANTKMTVGSAPGTLTASQALSPITAQQAKIEQITAQGEAKRLAIIAKGEAEVTAIRAKEALTQQAALQKQTQTELAIIQKQMAQEKLLYMQSRRTAFESKPTGMAGLMERRASWMLTGGAIFGGMAGIGETVSTIKEVEMGMTTIARVTEDVNFNFKGMRDELQQLGVTYGDTWGDVSDIAIKWAQAGYDQAETLELTKDSLLALNTAELNSEQATSGLIAIMAQWGLTAEDLLPVIDKINKVSDDYAVTSTDLVGGLQRSSGAAKVLGLTLEETIALITTMREATGRTGKEVGNALNSILSFMQRDKAISTFEDLGIQVFADKARTQFRNVIEIFDDMAAKWPQMGEAARDALTSEAEAAGLFSEEMSEAVGLQEQWNDLQQRDLSQAAAGVYRRNYLLALLQNWSKVDEVLLSQENALGYSMKENERTMQTLDKQIEVLKASCEQLAVALGDSGLLNELKGLVEGTISVVQWFNNLDDTSQTILLTLVEVTVAVKLLSAAMKGLGISSAMAGIGGLMAGWSVPIRATNIATRGLMTALTGATTLASNLGKGIIAAMGGPVVAGIIAVTTAAIALGRVIAQDNQEFKEHATYANSVIGQYDELRSKVNNATEGTKEHTDALKEYNRALSGIGDKIPELITGYDEYNERITINEKKLRELAEAGKELESIDAKSTIAESELDNLKKQVAAVEKLAQTAQNNKQLLSDLVAKRNELSAALAKQSKDSKEAAKSETELSDIDKLITKTATEGGLARLESAGFTTEAINSEIAKLEEERVAHINNKINFLEQEKVKTENLKSLIIQRLQLYEAEINALAAGEKWYQKVMGISTGIPLAPGGFAAQGIEKLSKLGVGWAQTAAKYLPQNYIPAEITGDYQNAINQGSAQVNALNAELIEVQDAIDEAKAEALKISTGTSSGGGGPSSKSGGGGSSTDAITEYLKSLGDAAKQFDLVNAQLESSLDSVNQKLSVAGAEYDYLSAKMESGVYTAQDYARMQELVAIKSALITDEQNRLSNANDVYQREIAALTPLLSEAMAEYEKYKNAGDVEHMEDAADAASSLQGDIDSLTSSIADNTAKIYSNKTALDELSRSTYAKYYQNMKDWLSHMEAIGEMSVKQQLKYLDALDETKLSMKDLWDLQEREYQARKKLLDEEMASLKKAYDTRMDYYEEEIKANERLIDSKKDAIDTYRAGIDAQIAAIKELMDLLDEEDESADRESQLQDHNEAIADLEEQLLYEQVRTGIDHQRNMDDIQKQIAEENRRWAEKQAQWGRQDQKDAYQDQIDALEKKADAYEDAMNEEIKVLEKTNDAKKDEMERYYDQIQDMLDESSLEMLASLSLHGDEAVAEVEAIMGKIKDAIQRGDLAAVSTLMSQLQAALGTAQGAYDSYTGGGSGGAPTQPGSSPVATFSSGEYYLENGRSYASSRTIASKLGQSISWDGSMVTIGGKKFYPAKIDSSGLSYLGINTVATALGYGVNWDQASGIVSILKQAHTGAYVTRTGAAELLKGERVLSPELTVSFDRLASILAESSLSARGVTNNNIFGGNVDMSVVERKLDRLIAVMSSKNILTGGPLVNIEHAGFEDKADMQVLGVQVRDMLGARG